MSCASSPPRGSFSSAMATSYPLPGASTCVRSPYVLKILVSAESLTAKREDAIDARNFPAVAPLYYAAASDSQFRPSSVRRLAAISLLTPSTAKTASWLGVLIGVAHVGSTSTT
ncbi:hypothetical protein MKEN_01457000 [Mycena kentingensis (nom. inval.)]|nr:hypothetical protein MKEN_01457000 [Mycena kentingensis (nom. inval.)]